MAQSPVNRNINTAVAGVAITPGTPFDPCTAVNCAVAGASTVTWLDGSTSSVYFVQGSANPFQITNIAAGGDSSGFVALYNQ